MAATFTLLLDQLKKTHPQALEILKFVSFLGSQDIPKRFLKRWMIDYKACNEFEFHEALSALLKISLFESNKENDPDKKDERYSIHSTLHAFIRDQLSKKEREKYLNEVALFLLSYLQGSSYKLWKILFDDRYLEFHLKSLLDLSENHDSDSNALLLARIKYLNFIYFFKCDYENSAKKVNELEKVVNKNTEIEPIERARFFLLLGNIATIHSSYEDAILISEKAQQILSEMNSHEAKEELFLLLVNNLMDFYNTRGNLKKAEESGKKAEALIPYIKYPTYLTLYYFMRSYQLLTKGDYEEALRHVEIAIKNYSSTEFPEHFHIFNKIIKAEILARLERCEEALDLLKNNYKEYQKYYPNQSNFKLLRMDMVRAFISLKKEEYELAFSLIKETIKKLNTLFKKESENPIQGFSHIILGEVYEKQGNFIKALEEYKKAEEVYTHIFKTVEVDDISYLYKNLTILGEKMNDDFLSKHYLERLIEHFGLDHKRTIESLQYLDKHKRSVL